MTLFLYRLMGAAVLDGGSYEGVEANPRVTWQAAAIVVVSSAAAGVGAGGFYGLDAATVVSFGGLALVTWVAWAMLTFQIGTRMLPGPDTSATLGELLRTTGFAAAPGVLFVFAVLPGMATPVFVLATAWMFAAMVVGVRHALDYQSNGQALAVCAAAAGLSASLAVLGSLLFGPALS
jgi:Yip1 domain